MGIMLGNRQVMLLKHMSDWWTIYTLGTDLTEVAASGTLREGNYCKCSKRQPVVCREKATAASVVRGGQWYVTRKQLL